MSDQEGHQSLRLVGGSGRNTDIPPFQPRIDARDIFHEMILTELRAGRLTRTRRRHIVGYAAQMGLSATEAGRLLAACREEALQSDDPSERYHALRLAEPDDERPHVILQVAVVTVVTVLLHGIVTGWLW